MTTVLDRIADTVHAHDLEVRKTIPRAPDHLLLVLRRSDGSLVAGQWFDDPERARRVADETRVRAGDAANVRVLPDSGVLLQPDGADRRLRTLHRLATAPGATLVAHRAERRALVRRIDDQGRVTYTKHVRPDHLDAMVTRTRVYVDDVAVPRVTDVDARAGTMTCAALPGRTLQALLDDPSVPPRALATTGFEVGRALARLHATAPTPTMKHHDAVAELGVTRRWLQRARAHGLVDDARPPVRDRVDELTRLITRAPCATTFVHRDLHDLQLLVDVTGHVGVLDFDLAAIGEPALDLANLLVHLELKALIWGDRTERTDACTAAIVEGYAPDADTWRRVPAYALSTRLRLLAVNAFRPPRAHLGTALLTGSPTGPLRG
jgi:aminoglycoside phosphotransferase (APT) family kinase protein